LLALQLPPGLHSPLQHSELEEQRPFFLQTLPAQPDIKTGASVTHCSVNIHPNCPQLFNVKYNVTFVITLVRHIVTVHQVPGLNAKL
jgi:hypothetical protein